MTFKTQIKLLSVNPEYSDAPREAIRRILNSPVGQPIDHSKNRCEILDTSKILDSENFTPKTDRVNTNGNNSSNECVT